MIEGYCTTSAFGFGPDGLRVRKGIPLSAAAGDVVSFHLSADAPYTVTYLRLRNQADVFNGTAMGDPFSMPAHVQPMPADQPWLGCAWSVDFTLRVPADWPSGYYAAYCQSATSEDFFVVFIVKPFSLLALAAPPGRRRRFAVLAPTNTWNAYNHWGGRDQYTTPNATELSFERPNPQTRPAPPYSIPDLDGRVAVDGYTRSRTRAELWILTWLEDAGYSCDVFTDLDFHAWVFDPADYAGLILNTHPEYWSIDMRDRLDSFLAAGGRLIYLGGNGLYERVEFTPDLDVMLMRRGDPGHQNRWLFQNQGRAELDVLGVAYDGDNWMGSAAGYRTRRPDHRFLRGTGLVYDAPFGESGLTGAKATAENGKACGWEMDNQGPNPPAGTVLLAEAADIPGGSQMTCWDRNGGFVYSVGSLIYGGSLALDPILQRILHNVLDECLYPHGRFPEIVESTVLEWIRAGLLAVGPHGRVPVPPQGPARDIWIGLIISELANDLSAQSMRSRLRETAFEFIAQTAQEELRGLPPKTPVQVRTHAGRKPTGKTELNEGPP
jgi:hypothetical protein